MLNGGEVGSTVDGMPVIPPKEPRKVSGHPVTTVRIPADLLAELDVIAREEGYSRNEVINFLLRAGLEQHRGEQAKKKR